MQILIVVVGSVFTLLSIRYLLMVRAARQAMARKEAPIVPHFIPFVGFALQFATPESRIALVSRLRGEYGPAFRIVMAGRCVLMVADLDLWRLVLRSAGTQAGVADAFSESVLKGFEPFISPKEAASSQSDAAHMKATRSEIQNPEGVLLMSERAQRCIIADTRKSRAPRTVWCTLARAFCFERQWRRCSATRWSPSCATTTSCARI
jgi:hypothetical protein